MAAEVWILTISPVMPATGRIIANQWIQSCGACISASPGRPGKSDKPCAAARIPCLLDPGSVLQQRFASRITLSRVHAVGLMRSSRVTRPFLAAFLDGGTVPSGSSIARRGSLEWAPAITDDLVSYVTRGSAQVVPGQGKSYFTGYKH